MILIFPVSCSEKGIDPYPEINIPAYDNSYDISSAYNESIFGKTLRYSVQEQFPAPNIIKFYESFLSEKGFSELKDFPYSNKAWVKFNKKCLKWDIVADSPPARYFRAWVDSHKNLIFKLTLKYDDNEDLSVTCFLHPYARHDLFSEFDKWVSDMGKDQKFSKAAEQDKQNIEAAYRAFKATIQNK